MKHSHYTLTLGLAVLTVLALAIPASAQVTEYTNEAAFTAASQNLSTIDFATANTNGAGTYTSYNTASGLTLQGVNFVGAVSDGTYVLAAIDPAFYTVYSGWNGNPTVISDGSNTDPFLMRTLNITLPANTTAIGTGLYTVRIGDGFANTVSDVTFTLSTGDTFIVNTFEKPTVAFAGFTSSTPITSLTVTAPDGIYPDLSNFTFGQAVSTSSVPEPGAYALLGSLGLTGAALLRRRRAR